MMLLFLLGMLSLSGFKLSRIYFLVTLVALHWFAPHSDSFWLAAAFLLGGQVFFLGDQSEGVFSRIKWLFFCLCLILKPFFPVGSFMLAALIPFHLVFKDFFLRCEKRTSFVGVLLLVWLSLVDETVSGSIWAGVSALYLILLSYAQKDVRSYLAYRGMAIMALLHCWSHDGWVWLFGLLVEALFWTFSSRAFRFETMLKDIKYPRLLVIPSLFFIPFTDASLSSLRQCPSFQLSLVLLVCLLLAVQPLFQLAKMENKAASYYGPNP